MLCVDKVIVKIKGCNFHCPHSRYILHAKVSEGEGQVLAIDYSTTYIVVTSKQHQFTFS